MAYLHARLARLSYPYLPILSIYAQPRARLRRCSWLMLAQAVGTIAETGLLIGTLSFSSATGWAVLCLAGWVGMSAANTGIDYQLRRTLSQVADQGTARLWSRLGEHRSRQRGTHPCSASAAAHDWHTPAQVQVVHNAAKYHLPYVLVDAVGCLAAGASAALVASLTASGWAIPALLVVACTAALGGHRALLNRSAHWQHQQQVQHRSLLSQWNRLCDHASYELLRRSGRLGLAARLLQQQAGEHRDTTQIADRYRLHSGVLTQLLTRSVTIAAVAGVLAGSHASLALPVVFMLSVQALAAAMRLPDNLQASTPALAAGRELSALLRQPSRLSEPGNPQVLPAQASLRLKITGLQVSYENLPPILNGVDFDVAPGQVLAITGAVGSGKTTLLRSLCRLEPWQVGQVQLAGVDISQLSFETLDATVYLLPATAHVVTESLTTNVQLAHPDLPRAEAEKALLVAGFTQAELDARPDEPVAQLSSGQARRVEWARALVHPAQVVLMDEPTANLDAAGVVSFSHVIAGLRQQGKTVIFTTHNPALLSLAERHLHLQQGRLQPVHPQPDRAYAAADAVHTGASQVPNRPPTGPTGQDRPVPGSWQAGPGLGTPPNFRAGSQANSRPSSSAQPRSWTGYPNSPLTAPKPAKSPGMQNAYPSACARQAGWISPASTPVRSSKTGRV